MGFEFKKLHTETLYEYLTSVRKGLGLSLDDAVNKTGVCLKYLQALETGNYNELPPEVYVTGFLKQIAQVYSIDSADLIAQYKKESGITQQVVNPKPLKESGFKEFVKKLTITPRFVSIAAILIFILGTVGYLSWQVTSLSRAPKLQITSPMSNAKVLGAVVMVEGKTDPGSIVEINKQNVLVGQDGKFQTAVSLTNGQAELRIEAKNKFDRSVTKTIPLVVEQQIPRVAGAETEQPSTNLFLELGFNKAATITVTVDGQTLPQEAVSAGSSKFIQAKDKILLSTSNAGAMTVILNEQSLGILGKDEEVLMNVPFTLESLAGLKTKNSKEPKK